MALLELTLLGSFSVTVAGQPLGAPLYAKVRALLAYLAVESDRPHHRDTLAALLWPEQDEAHARLNLRKALSQLRAALADAGVATTLDTTREAIRISPGSVQLDCALFGAALDGGHGRAQATEGQLRALELYRGPFLDQLIVGDSVPFTEWQVLMRERLHRRAVAACAALSARFAAEGRWAEARAYAERHLELEPWDEGAHRSLMRALAATGQRVAAIQQYERCRQMLERELGVQPEPATIALYTSLRAGGARPDHAALREAPAVTPQAPPGAWDNLPTPTTAMVGRGPAVAELVTTLCAGEARLLTLTGTVGCGKTRLALAASAAARAHFRDGACFVALSELHEPALLPAALLRALGADAPETPDADRRLLGVLRNRRLLLVLDGCEHLYTVAPLGSLLLAACPQLTIFCTSRAPLRLYGEWLYTVPSLGLPPAGDQSLATTMASEAVELFVLRARAAVHGFDLTEANAAAVGKICHALDGLPLAIELAAAQMRRLSPVALLAQLDRLDLLVDGPRDVAKHHRSLRAAIERSYGLLTLGQRGLLDRLGSFSGPFTAREARATLTLHDPWALDDDLEALVEHHLVRRTGDHEARYELWATVCAFARERAGVCDASSGESTLLFSAA